MKLSMRFFGLLFLLLSCADNSAQWEEQEKIKTYELMKNQHQFICILGMPCDQINWCGPHSDPTMPCKPR